MRSRAGHGAVVRGAVQPHPIPPHREFPQRRHGDRNRAFGDGDFHATPAEPAGIVGSVAVRAHEPSVFAAENTLTAVACHGRNAEEEIVLEDIAPDNPSAELRQADHTRHWSSCTK